MLLSHKYINVFYNIFNNNYKYDVGTKFRVYVRKPQIMERK
jgi:hypothetical protein